MKKFNLLVITYLLQFHYEVHSPESSWNYLQNKMFFSNKVVIRPVLPGSLAPVPRSMETLLRKG